MFTYGVFFKEFQSAFGWSRALISGASSLAFLIMGIGGIIAGTLNDRIGPRIIMTVSGISLGLGYLFMSRLTEPWQLYLLYGGFVGIGFCTLDVITLSTVARWFIKRRGMMSGIVKVGTGAGQFFVPLAATMLISEFGWRTAYLMVGGFALVVLVLLAQVLKRDPRDFNMLPDGNTHPDKSSSPDIKSHGMSLSMAFGTLQFRILCIAEFFVFFCLFTTIIHIIPHARDLGLPPTIAATVLSTIGAVSMLGRIVMGSANDKIGGRRSLSICLTILVSSFIWLQLSSNQWMLFLFAVVYGFAHGGLFTVISPTTAEFFGTGSHGQLFGTVLFCGTLGGALGPFLVGYIFDVTGSYQGAFILLTVLALISLLLIAFLRPLNRMKPS